MLGRNIITLPTPATIPLRRQVLEHAVGQGCAEDRRKRGNSGVDPGSWDRHLRKRSAETWPRSETERWGTRKNDWSKTRVDIAGQVYPLPGGGGVDLFDSGRR